VDISLGWVGKATGEIDVLDIAGLDVEFGEDLLIEFRLLSRICGCFRRCLHGATG